MGKALLLLAALAVSILGSAPASAETRTFCVTDAAGTRTCTTVSVVRRTTRIMGISAKKYIRGLREGKCMPSPSGACGGG